MDKVYTIGRDESCDIVIEDATDVVSRMHAVLKDKGRDKYVLVDHSRNGTYVNGIKMNPNEEVPVTRKDTISLAHAKDLDWSLIPQSKSTGHRYIIIGLCALCVVAIAMTIYCIFAPSARQQVPEEQPQPVTVPEPVAADTVVVAQPVIQTRDTVLPEPVQPTDITPDKTTKPSPAEQSAKHKPVQDQKPQTVTADHHAKKGDEPPAKKGDEPPAKNDDDPVINPIF